MQAVILAGGKGSRLKPFTTSIPKPLVPVGDYPILAILIQQLKQAGVHEVILAVNHLAELIMAYFGDGKKFGLKIHYSREDIPLGTAAPLQLIENLQDDFLLMNGDLLTTIDFKKLMQFHQSEKNDLSLTLYKKDIKIDLGVIESQGSQFLDYIEKPTYHFEVSTGVYAVSKKNVVDLIPKNEKFDLPDLVKKAHQNQLKVGCYRDQFEWLDIGNPDDYSEACERFEKQKSLFLKP